LGVVFGLAAVIAIAVILVVFVLRRGEQADEADLSLDETDLNFEEDLSTYEDVPAPENEDQVATLGQGTEGYSYEDEEETEDQGGESYSYEEEDLGEESYSEVSYSSEAEP
jgi:hypothetical protein